MCDNMPRSCNLADWELCSDSSSVNLSWAIKTLQHGIQRFFPLHIVALEFIQSLSEFIPFKKEALLANHLNNRTTTWVYRMHFQKESRIDIFRISLNKMSQNVNKCYQTVCAKASSRGLCIKIISFCKDPKSPNWRTGMLLCCPCPPALTSSWLDYYKILQL